MVVGCRGPRRQGRTSSSDYVTPVTAAPCGCTLDCLCLQPITHRSSRDSCHSPPRTYARGLQGYRSPLPLGWRPTPVRRSRWRNNRRLERPRTTTPGVSFPTQPATAITLAGKSPRPVTRAARADVAKGSTFPFFPLSLSLSGPLPVAKSTSFELVCTRFAPPMANRPVKGSNR